MAVAIRLLSAVGAGNWTEFHRILGRTSPGGAWPGCNEVLVGGEGADSSFAIRLRCLSYAMLLPIRAHALRALNKSFGKKESVPLVRICAHRSKGVARGSVPQNVSFLAQTTESFSEALRSSLSDSIACEVKPEHNGFSFCTSVFSSLHILFRLHLYQVDVRKSLQMPTDEHTAGLCRALSLPVEPDGCVIFKAVPAVWKNADARQAGFLPPPGEPTTQSFLYSREDKWVGIESGWLTKSIAASEGAWGDKSGGTCQSCGGFGCRWCEVDAEEVISWGLWEAALAPM